MFKKITSAAVILSLSLGLCSCHQMGNETFDETVLSTQSVTTQITETAETTESVTYEEITTTETVAATTQTTTQATTVSPTATKKPTTSAKPVTTTKKPTVTAKPTTTRPSTTAVTTTAVTTTKPTTTSPYTYIEYDRKEETAENIELKYGVFVSRSIITYYEKLDDGSEVVIDTRVSEVFNRMGYAASYADLLPAVKENREKYADMINKVLEIINGYRAEKGIAPLKLNENLMNTAGARAEEIAWSGIHSHTRPTFTKWSSILADAGVSTGHAGENIGRGYSTAEDVCLAWKNSETHYKNIMNPDFTETGIGIAADPDTYYKLCWAQHFWKP